MANKLYPNFKQALGTGSFNLVEAGDDIRVILVDTGQYTQADAHTNLGDIPAGARIATAPLLAQTWVGAVFDADDVTFTAVAAGTGTPASNTIAEAVVIYKHTGTPATSLLIAYIDTATGLPVTPNGGDIQIVWDSGANKIFKL